MSIRGPGSHYGIMGVVMFLNERSSGHMVEILSLRDLFDPYYTDVVGRYHYGEEVQDPGNRRKVVGIVGASRIGRRLIELLQPFDYELLLFDPTLELQDARGLGVEACTGATERSSPKVRSGRPRPPGPTRICACDIARRCPSRLLRLRRALGA